jgi:hypothetical protein
MATCVTLLGPGDRRVPLRDRRCSTRFDATPGIAFDFGTDCLIYPEQDEGDRQDRVWTRNYTNLQLHFFRCRACLLPKECGSVEAFP